MRRHLTRVQRSFKPATQNLGQKVVSGALFTVGGVAFRTAVTILSMALLARLLTPADFGLIAMATVITELAALFANFGFGSILIQRPRVARIQLDTMHWCAVSLGLVLTVTVFGASFVAGELFRNPMVADLLRVLCISFLLEELTLVPKAILARRMQFRTDFYVQATMLLGRAGTAVALAMNGFGVWSLAYGPIVGLLIQAIGYQLVSGYRPRFRFSRSYLSTTWKTNGGHFGNGALFYINANLDVFLIGRLLGAAPLGIYQNAKSLTDEVRVRMVQPLQRVLFPAFSAIQNEEQRFQQGILRSGRLLAAFFVPIGFGMAAEAELLVRILYGPQWVEMVPLLQLTALITGFSATTSIANAIFNAKNEVGLSFRLFLLSSILSAIFVIVGSAWGTIGIVWSKVALVPVGLVFFRIALGLVGLKWKHIGQMLLAPILAASVMHLIMSHSHLLVLQLSGNVGLALAVQIAIGATCYLLGLRLLSRRHTDDMMTVLAKTGVFRAQRST